MVLHATYVANIYGYPFVVSIPVQSGSLKKILNASKNPLRIPQTGGKMVKTFRWEHKTAETNLHGIESGHIT